MQSLASPGITAQSQVQQGAGSGVPPLSTHGFGGNQGVPGKEKFSIVS